VLTAAVWTCRRRGWAFWEVADTIALSVPIGLGLGRIGNFINGELYGRESDLPWAMVFPAGGAAPRHPSQLYEALLEGLVLFGFLLWLYRRNMKPGSIFWGLIGGYGLVRFLVEFVRAPDTQIGFDLGPFTRGQILSFPMLLMGAIFLARTSFGTKPSGATEARPGRPVRRRSKKK
jgi:phosphatidylglycerol:prolipoprotein diacylglycerol transferase